MLMMPDVSNVLDIGLVNAYNIVRRPDFPSITVPSRYLV